MSVRHALLALLSEGPKYGLQLREEFEARTGEVWPLNVGQVYTTLQRLERDGLVTPAFKLSQTTTLGTPPIVCKALTCARTQSPSPSDQRASA